MTGLKADLRKLLLEAAAIVASILIAFAIDSSWDEFQEDKQRDYALAALRTEFQDTHAGALSTRNFHEEEQVRLLRLLELTQQPPEDLDVEEFVQLVQGAIVFSTFLPPTGAMDSLVGSGDLNSLLEPELRSELAQFQKDLESMYRTQQWGLAFVNEELTTYLGKRVPLVVFGFSRGELREIFSTYYSEAEVEVYARKLLGSLEFQNLIHTRLLVSDLLEMKAGHLVKQAGIICIRLSAECPAE